MKLRHLFEETLDDYLRHLENNGHRKIGRGMNSLVFSIPGDESSVLKVLYKEDTAYLAYLRMFCARHTNNPWLPKVRSIKGIILDSRFRKQDVSVWLITLEKLERATNEDVVKAVRYVISTVDTPHFKRVKPLDNPTTFDDITKPHWEVIAEHSSDNDIRVFAKFLSSFRQQDIDVSNSNVMMRGPKLVFADPVL